MGAETTEARDLEGLMRHVERMEEKYDRLHKAVARVHRHAKETDVKTRGHYCEARIGIQALVQMTAAILKEHGQ